MKKLLSILMVLGFTFAFVACNQSAKTETAEDATETMEEVAEDAEEAAEEVEEAAEEATDSTEVTE